jgi:hypothetical protein
MGAHHARGPTLSVDLTHALRGTVKGSARFFSSATSQVVNKWRATTLQCVEIERFIVGRSILPTAKENSDPFERECPDGSLM